MKKLLLVFTSLLSITSIATTVANKDGSKNNEIPQTLISSKEWHFDPYTVSKNVAANEWLYFAIDNINLSSMGIKTIDDLHLYKTIEMSGLKVKYDDKVALSGDSWKAARNTGSENWYRMFDKVDGMVTMYLESASTIWYSNSGDLMMRLAYHGSMIRYIPPRVTVGGTITFESGSVVKIY